ncbi:MAG: SDR family NAD(P)-dependent oxidoreductase [Alphaproteobacteria bacterium]|nr:SDR family NAD(P)-dependent oxidoreductase [Alphaproteobacteria bacterium]
MEQRRVTVIGGSGFIGRYVVERLADQGAVVTVAVRDVEKAKFLRPLGQVGQVTPVAVNVRETNAVARAVEGADAVINLVGILYKSGHQKFSTLHAEVPAAIGQVCADQGIKRLVHVSAIGAQPSAWSEYQRSKGAGEEALRAQYPDATILRPSVLFGPEDGFFNLFGALARILPVLPLYGGGKTRFQPVYVGDVAAAIVNALANPATAGKTYELGGPAVLTYAELMEIILEHTGRKRLLVPVPFFVGEIQATFLGMMPKPLLTRDQILSLKTDNIVAEDALTLADLGVQPTTLEAIIPTYLRRHRKGGRLGRASIV